MQERASINELWDTAPGTGQVFSPDGVAGLPEAARLYLEHAIAPGTPLASAVRMRMRGEIRLKGWCPFQAEQVSRCDGAFLWRALLRLHGIPVTGFDSLVANRGRMQWKLLGIFPLASGAGADVTRSAIGRLQGEAIWLPSLLCGGEVAWTAPDASHAHARYSVLGEETELALTLASTGRLEQVRFRRWGNPEGGAFGYADFGGFAEEEATFGGYTIPTRLRVGWHLGTEGFVREGEFFRVALEDAQFR